MFIPVFLFFFVFSVYLRTHCASFNINDSGETIMVCDLLTISHSPGYPLHTLWGRVNCLLPIGKPMFRVTFCSLLTGAISVVFVYWILKMMLKGIFTDPANASGTVSPATAPPTGQSSPEGVVAAETSKPGAWLWEIPAVFGALIFAFSYQHWFQACGAKGGIYTLNTLMSVCMLYLFFKMREAGWFIKSFLLMGFLYGLSLTHHWPNQIVMAPAYFWLFLSSQKRVPMGKMVWNLFTLKLIDLVENLMQVLSAFGSLNIIRAIICGLLSLSVYTYLPIRATQHPLVNWWNPQTAGRLWGTVMREGYKGVGDMRGWTTMDRDLKRFWVHAHHEFGDVFTLLMFGLAIFGVIWLMRWNAKQWLSVLAFLLFLPFSVLLYFSEPWVQTIKSVLASDQKRWTTGVGFFLFGFGVFSGIILFNNPLEGYQWTIDNFFTPVYLTIAMFAALGMAGLCEWASREWPVRATSIYATALSLSFSIMPLILNFPPSVKEGYSQPVYEGNDQSRYVSSYDEGMNMLKTVNDDGVILCNGDIDILPLWYLQYVEGKRPKVVSFTMQLIPYDWYRNPLFERWPFLKVDVGQDIRPETVVQNMIEQHAQDRSFYFTNIFTAPWMRDKNPSMPEGFLWRMIKTKNLNYPFTSQRLNLLWSTYRLRYLDEPDRGYWDEYTDVMKDSYGIGHDFTGYFALMNKMPDIALWSFNNALKYRQPQTLMRIYLMLGETYLALGDPGAAINSYQETLKRDPRNPYAYAKIGDAFRMMKNLPDAESAYRAALSLNPQQKEALDGLQAINQAQQAPEAPGKKP